MTSFAEFLILFGFLFILKFIKNEVFFPEKKYINYDLLAGALLASVGLFVYGDCNKDISILITALIGLWITAVLIDQIYRSESARKENEENESESNLQKGL